MYLNIFAVLFILFIFLIQLSLVWSALHNSFSLAPTYSFIIGLLCGSSSDISVLFLFFFFVPFICYLLSVPVSIVNFQFCNSCFFANVCLQQQYLNLLHFVVALGVYHIFHYLFLIIYIFILKYLITSYKWQK